MGIPDKIKWYANRLKAMDSSEINSHFQKKFNAIKDQILLPDWSRVDPLSQPGKNYPRLPETSDYPEHLLDELKWETWDLFKGNWKAFGWLDITVADPPEWHKDHMVNVDVKSTAWGFQLNHRELPSDADVKLVWELSRFYALVRMVQGAWILSDSRLAEVALRWLHSWNRENPPFRGWNWTSALESGIRLIQLAWIDTLTDKIVWKDIDQRKAFKESWEDFKKKSLGPHVYYTWRYRSFGSSANNHLIGELSGLIIALVKWPALSAYTISLSQLKSLWEAEVLAQFAEDGGNKEQALNYQLFSFEFCWQVRNALMSANIHIRADVEDRLRAAAMFFRNMQVPEEPWDFGDGDSAIVTPVAADSTRPIREWWDWLNVPEKSPVISFWMGLPPEQPHRKCGEFIGGKWLLYNGSGYAITRTSEWVLRWDLSPLGYLSIAAHGHLDALHVSIWYKSVAVIIDPGTGAYYGDKMLRNYLASREAHNGPNAPSIPFGERSGPFMWKERHPDPVVRLKGEDSLLGQVTTGEGHIKRHIAPINSSRDKGWLISDVVAGSTNQGKIPFFVRWQCAPESKVTAIADREWLIERNGIKLRVEISTNWEEYHVIQPDGERQGAHTNICSSAFRKVQRGPVIELYGTGQELKKFETKFLSME